MNKTKILLVDDDYDFLVMMSKKIESYGYTVITAANGREAIEAIKKKQADMAILDYKMAELDGLATLKEIRTLDNAIPVIMFTLFPDKRSIEGTETLGISAYVPKFSAFSDAEASLHNTIKMVEKRLPKKTEP